MTLCLKFEDDLISGCWDIQLFIFWGHLPLEVLFHWRPSSIAGLLHWNLSSSSSIEGCLHSNLFSLWFDLMSLWSDQWLLRYSFFFYILSSSSIRGHLALKVVFIETFLTLVCSPELMFKIWGKFDQWLLRYSNFHILRSSSIRGRLPLKVVFIKTFFDFGVVPWTYV